jgi:kynurenine formamidase
MDNWNRWGAADERGAANLVDADAVRRGLAAVRDGRPISLAAPIVANRGFGLVERAGFGFADDWVAMPTHGVSHLDALSHIWQSGLMYNGHEASSVTSKGARRCGIEKVGPIVTRGVLVDLLAPGQSYLSPGEPVSAERLQGALDALGLELQPGDALLVRTGWLAAWAAGAANASAWPGLHLDCA